MKTNFEPMTTATLDATIAYSQRAAGAAIMHRRWATADEEYLLTGYPPMRVLYVALPTRTDAYVELNDPGC